MPELEEALRRTALQFPKIVRFRALNAFRLIDEADSLLSDHRELASFSAITAEEEAATALFKALQYQNYPLAELLNPRDHMHKAALFPFVWAVSKSFGMGIKNFQIDIDVNKRRIDVHVPLSEFGIVFPESENLRLSPVEPLNLDAKMVGEPGGIEPPNRFEKELAEIANGSNFATIKTLVAEQAKSRNILLYASDSSLPRSKATKSSLISRRRNVMVAVALSVIVLQTSIHQRLAVRGIEVLLDIVGRLPPDVIPAA